MIHSLPLRFGLLTIPIDLTHAQILKQKTKRLFALSYLYFLLFRRYVF